MTHENASRKKEVGIVTVIGYLVLTQLAVKPRYTGIAPHELLAGNDYSQSRKNTRLIPIQLVSSQRRQYTRSQVPILILSRVIIVVTYCIYTTYL